jgi:hypothetical protein
MTEVKVTKDPKTEYTEMSPWFGLEAPLIRSRTGKHLVDSAVWLLRREICEFNLFLHCSSA